MERLNPLRLAVAMATWCLVGGACVGDDTAPADGDGSSSGGGTTGDVAVTSTSTGPGDPSADSSGDAGSSGEPTSTSTDDGDTTAAGDTAGTTADDDTAGTTAAATDTGAAGSTTGGARLGDCCEAHGTPGCDDPRIEACVCDFDPECCAFGWDAICIATAQSQCDACGGAGTGTTAGTDTGGSSGTDTGTGGTAGGTGTTGGDGPCCTPSDVGGCEIPEVEECVCGFDNFCCDVEWDELCVQTGIDLCDSGCGPPASCCDFSLDPGCADPKVQACVCEFEPSCCDTEWNGICVAYAAIECGGGCEVASGRGDCCDRDNPTPGCDDPLIETCVCVDDPFCCEVVWDLICVQGATGPPCFAECMLGTTGDGGDCCDRDNPTPGCNDPGIADCVCNLMPGCCLDPWDEDCVVFATENCDAICF